MLNFCPYKYEKIDMDNLAYELVFPQNQSFGEVKEKTVLGYMGNGYIDENDHRGGKFFGVSNTQKRVILLEKGEGRERNGLDLLRELADQEEYDSEYDFEPEYDENGFERMDDDDRAAGQSVGKQRLHYQVEDGVELFTDDYGDVIMYAFPCCPRCHSRLPIGWNRAEDFAAVSLMAPSGRGKTTLLLSMMHRDWIAFRNLGALQDGSRLHIAPAYLPGDDSDILYAEMKKRSVEMCRKGGSVPQNTDREHWIPPVFLNVQYNGHVMIVGIYDNAGGNLRDFNPMKYPNQRMLLNEMFAYIFLFDPEDLNVELPEKVRKEQGEYTSDCQLLSLEEQGALQRSGGSIMGDELLRQSENSPEEKSMGETLELYNNFISVVQNYNYLDLLRTKYFLGVIIKSDLLEEHEEIRSDQKFNPLFGRDRLDDLLDKDARDMRSALVRDMITEFRLFGKQKVENFENDFFAWEQGDGGTRTQEAVSWHCISALGCDCDKPSSGTVGKLKGEYAPIRVAEPLVTCILKRIADNGWID